MPEPSWALSAFPPIWTTISSLNREGLVNPKTSLGKAERWESPHFNFQREKSGSPNQKKKKKKNRLSSVYVLFLKVSVFPDLTFEQFTFVWNHPIIPLEPSEGQILLHPVVLTTNIPLNNKISKSQTQALLLETFPLKVTEWSGHTNKKRAGDRLSGSWLLMAWPECQAPGGPLSEGWWPPPLHCTCVPYCSSPLNGTPLSLPEERG